MISQKTGAQLMRFWNDYNVMAEILISRYAQYIENNSVPPLPPIYRLPNWKMLMGTGCVYV